MLKNLNLFSLLLGICLLSYGGYLLYLRTRPLPPPIISTSLDSSSILPRALSIPSLSVSAPIYPSQIVAGKWETSSSGISYLTSSPLPGDLGNSVMYGHNWSNLLSPLKQIKPGDKIFITQSSGKQISYTTHFVTVVTPDQSHITSNTTDHRLTLYTCSGFLDSKRLVVTAILDTSI